MSQCFDENLLISTCHNYLQKYAAKDLLGIKEMFADDIVLRDWKIHVKGKKLAIAETNKNFNNADTIDINILSSYTAGNTAAMELKIVVDRRKELFVVDVITLNEEGKINSIKAYIGRGDE